MLQVVDNVTTDYLENYYCSITVEYTCMLHLTVLLECIYDCSIKVNQFGTRSCILIVGIV